MAKKTIKKEVTQKQLDDIEKMQELALRIGDGHKFTVWRLTQADIAGKMYQMGYTVEDIETVLNDETRIRGIMNGFSSGISWDEVLKYAIEAECDDDDEISEPDPESTYLSTGGYSTEDHEWFDYEFIVEGK